MWVGRRVSYSVEHLHVTDIVDIQTLLQTHNQPLEGTSYYVIKFCMFRKRNKNYSIHTNLFDHSPPTTPGKLSKFYSSYVPPYMGIKTADTDSVNSQEKRAVILKFAPETLYGVCKST